MSNKLITILSSLILLTIIVLVRFEVCVLNINLIHLTIFNISSFIIITLIFLVILLILFIKLSSITHFLGIVNCLIFGFLVSFIFKTDDYWYNWLSLFSFILVSIYVYKSNCARFLKNFLQNSPDNFVRTIATEQEYFLLAIAIATLSLIVLSILMNDLPNTDFGSTVIDIVFTMIGGFFSVLIYFKIDDKTKSLGDYMNKLIRILEDSRKDDEIYIISPTLFVGQEYHQNLHNKFKKYLFERIGIVTFRIANLYFDKKALYEENIEIESGEDKIKVNQTVVNQWFTDIKGCRTITTFKNPQKCKEIINKLECALNNFQKLLDKYSNNKKGLFSFHEIYVPFNDIDLDQTTLEMNICHHCKLIAFYKELLKKFGPDDDAINIMIHPKSGESNNKSTIKFLKWDYYDDPNLKIEYKSSKGYSNFFAVANITQGDYYIGQFIVNSNKVHEFHGTSFKNINISTQMKQMLDEFIRTYEVK